MNNIIEFKHVTKQFPGVVALDGIDMRVKRGEVHVLVGENGAGKSTLIKLLCGVHQVDEGTILYEMTPYAPKNPLDAIDRGIRCVYQEFNLMSNMTVAENIYFEDLPRKGGLVDYKKMHKDTEELLQKVGLENVLPSTPVELLGIAQMQLVEIARAISHTCKVLILDEPTATLTPPEITSLFEIIKNLKSAGVTIIYISHRLQELKEIGDRITVLRNGKFVGTWNISDLSTDQIVQKMVGRQIDANYPYDQSVKLGDSVFTVENLEVMYSKIPISFSVRAGEIRGISGLIGSGRTEAMRAIFGADKKAKGVIKLDNKELIIKRPQDAVKYGIGFITEDRKEQGLVLAMDCSTNIILPHIKNFSKFGYLLKSKEQKESERLVQELLIKITTLKQEVGNLSGGNQQKIALAKWLLKDPKVLILDEPTRGIDVNAKREIYLILWELARKGVAIIFISSDMPELLGVCHKISVFSKGRLVDTVERDAFDQEKILGMAYQDYMS